MLDVLLFVFGIFLIYKCTNKDFGESEKTRQNHLPTYRVLPTPTTPHDRDRRSPVRAPRPAPPSSPVPSGFRPLTRTERVVAPTPTTLHNRDRRSPARAPRPAPPSSPVPSGFRPLASTEQVAASEALGKSGDPNEAFAEYVTGKEVWQVLRSDMKTLSPGRCLNDNVVNFFMLMLRRRSPNTVFIHTSWFYTKLTKLGCYDYTGVRRWTNNEDLFSFDSVMVPICSNHHWTLAVINIKDKRFEYYDSLYGSDNHVLNTLRRYVADEHQDKMGVPIDLSTWTDHASIPKQTNNYDCGIFMCRTAEYLVRGRRMDFSQSHMAYFRKEGR